MTRGEVARERVAGIAERRRGGERGTLIAKELGVSRQRVYQMLKTHGYNAKGVRVEAVPGLAHGDVVALGDGGEATVKAIDATGAMPL